MKSAWLLLTVTTAAQAIAAPDELVSVDLTRLIAGMAAELNATDIALPGQIWMPKSEAAQACGLTSTDVTNTCTAVYSTDALRNAVAAMLHPQYAPKPRNR